MITLKYVVVYQSFDIFSFYFWHCFDINLSCFKVRLHTHTHKIADNAYLSRSFFTSSFKLSKMTSHWQNTSDRCQIQNTFASCVSFVTISLSHGHQIAVCCCVINFVSWCQNTAARCVDLLLLRAVEHFM